MQQPSKIEIATYAIALVFVAAIHIFPWMSAACDLSGWKDLMKVSGPSCAEFWINRYQSLIAAFAAAAIALFVARPVFRQMLEMNKQSAVAARQVVLSKIESYSQEYAAANAITETAGTIAGYLSNLDTLGVRNQAMLEFYDRVSDAAQAMRDNGTIIEKFVNSEPRSADRSATRWQLLREVESLSSDAADFATRLKANVYADNYAKPSIDFEAQAVVNTTRHVDRTCSSLRTQLSNAISASWHEVDRLESIVTRQ